MNHPRRIRAGLAVHIRSIALIPVGGTIGRVDSMINRRGRCAGLFPDSAVFSSALPGRTFGEHAGFRWAVPETGLAGWPIGRGASRRVESGRPISRGKPLGLAVMCRGVAD
jgi:hypothetical protein